MDDLERLKRQEQEANEEAEVLRKKFEHLVIKEGAARTSSTNIFSTVRTPAKASSTNIVNTVSLPVSTASPYEGLSLSDPTNPEEDDSEIPPLEDIYQNSTDGIFTTSSYDDEGAVADFTNFTMAVLDSCLKHNMVAYLEKSKGNAEFHEIIDFLKRSSIHHALTVSPVVSTTFVEQFWTSAKSKTINNVRHITAKVAGKSVSIFEASIRSDLLFDDADGIDSLPVSLKILSRTGSSPRSSMFTRRLIAADQASVFMAMTFEQRSSSLVLHQMTSDHNRSKLGIQDHSNEQSCSKLVPKVVP
ncbi:hypothetical protein Tco_0885811 [Tanacetum coccineum]